MVEIRRITPDDPLYEQERALRESVLMGPLGLTLDDLERSLPGIESRAVHYVCVIDHPTGPRVVGCAMLVPGDEEGQVLQVAIDRQRQGEGIGRRLMATIESHAFGGLGLTALACEAEDGAIGFYRVLGWMPEGEPFDRLGITHQRMVLRANPPDSGDAGPGRTS